ncbi:MAG TPA: hypothetical protein ENJ08_09160 [Gammaproteobacteria bacterium]|nr:hypothetical protein [Gammaproteobacteria bacterium]
MKIKHLPAMKLFIIPLSLTSQAANAHGGLASLSILYVMFFLFLAVVYGVSALICLIVGLKAKKRNQGGKKETHVVLFLVSAICSVVSIWFIYLAISY